MQTIQSLIDYFKNELKDFLDAELKNRSRLRPNPMTNALIINNLVSNVTFSLPMTNDTYLFI